MKTKTIFIVLVSLLVITAMVFQSCKKDNPKDPTPPVYTNGEGEIGEIGGTIKIDDPSSPINGASIEIPKGALEKEVDIKISKAPYSDLLPKEDSNGIVVKFEPEGLKFNEPVKIGLPYNDNSDDIRVYYLDEDSLIITELPLESVDHTNKIAYATTNHFSSFHAGRRFTWMNIDLVNINGKIGVRLNVFSKKDGEVGGLEGVLCTLWSAVNLGTVNGYEVITEDHGYEVFSDFNIELYHRKFGPWNDFLEREYFAVRRINNTSTPDGIKAYADYNTLTNQIYEIPSIDDEDVYEQWFQGYPLVTVFDHDVSEDDPDDKYYVKVKWALAFLPDAYLGSKYTSILEFNTYDEPVVFNDMPAYDNDQNGNRIDDDYETGGGGNNPPNPPVNVSPSDDATNVSTNVTLRWNCTDPDGDYLTYSILFGDNYPPSTYEATDIDDNYLEIDDLDPNTTYYWSVEAMDEEEVTEGPIWSFTTGGGGGGGNTPPVASFTVSPSSGNTSTTFSFDASGSYDNEDPASDLQVRWDFDGDGSWDTYWDYDKTTTHQYDNEGTYTVKLLVKDTEGLTAEDAKTVTVNNGGGGGTGTFTDPRDGQEYAYVEIGSQTWMAENLKYLPNVSPSSDGSLTDPYYYVYDYEGTNVSEAKATDNYQTYGVLYNWPAALNACPPGWHLPSDEEWNALIDYLGDEAGGKMKETGTTHWWYPNTGATNSSGFTALPGGYRRNNGSFHYLGVYGYWWSSSENLGTIAWYRYLYYYNDQVLRNGYNKTFGFSVRCLKD